MVIRPAVIEGRVTAASLPSEFAPLRGKHDFDLIVGTGMLDLVDMPPEHKEMAIKAGKIPTGKERIFTKMAKITVSSNPPH